MPIKSGRYTITNVRQRNLVTLPDPNDGTPLRADDKQNTLDEQWLVELRSNGRYLIKNIKHSDSFANAGYRAELKAAVEGRNERQYWLIQRTRTVGQYTICTTDTRLFWAFEDGEIGTSITLLGSPTDLRCWWIFEDIETGAAAEIDGKSATMMSKWATTTLHTIFGLLRGSQRKRNPEVTIPDSIVTIPDSVVTHPIPISQPDLDLAVIDSAIPVPPSSSQVFHFDIPFKISRSNGLFDPLTTLFQALVKVISAAQNIFKSDDEWEIPIRRLRFHRDTIKYHCVELWKDCQIDKVIPSPKVTIIKPLEKYASELRNVYQLICDTVPIHSSILNKEVEGTSNEETIGPKIGDMDLAFKEYTTALHRFADQAYKSLQKLPPIEQNLLVEVVKPHHMQSKRPNTYGVQHKECLPGTRLKTIKAIREWANSTSGATPTFLLLDVAGSGKSTVAKTMAEELGRTRLVARFFFSRDTAETRSTDYFCSTVSAAFIRLAPAIEAPIKAFKKRFDLNLLSFKDLFNGLVTGPLEKISLDAFLIIDALDECKDEDGSCSDLLNAIYSQRLSTPRLRILATGRPELHITRWAKQYNIEWHNFVRLEGSNKDVDLYIKQTLQDLPDTHVPVMKLANGVFIWARIACDLILKTADINRLLEELEAAVSLDYLYKVALNQSVPKDEGSRRVFAVVFQMILASRKPLSIAELEKLAPEPRIVEQIVARLGALLVYQDRNDPIRLLHATFREFLTTRSKADRYFIQIEPGHHTLTLGCVKYIEHTSTQSISIPRDLDTISRREEISFLNKPFIDCAFRVYIYSSKSWVHHCTASYRKLAMDPDILKFIRTRLQTWTYNADEWIDLGTIPCLRDVIFLSHQGIVSFVVVFK